MKISLTTVQVIFDKLTTCLSEQDRCLKYILLMLDEEYGISHRNTEFDELLSASLRGVIREINVPDISWTNCQRFMNILPNTLRNSKSARLKRTLCCLLHMMISEVPLYCSNLSILKPFLADGDIRLIIVHCFQRAMRYLPLDLSFENITKEKTPPQALQDICSADSDDLDDETPSQAADLVAIWRSVRSITVSLDEGGVPESAGSLSQGARERRLRELDTVLRVWLPSGAQRVVRIIMNTILLYLPPNKRISQSEFTAWTPSLCLIVSLSEAILMARGLEALKDMKPGLENIFNIVLSNRRAHRGKSASNSEFSGDKGALLCCCLRILSEYSTCDALVDKFFRVCLQDSVPTVRSASLLALPVWILRCSREKRLKLLKEFTKFLLTISLKDVNSDVRVSATVTLGALVCISACPDGCTLDTANRSLLSDNQIDLKDGDLIAKEDP
eukprot:626342_1